MSYTNHDHQTVGICPIQYIRTLADMLNISQAEVRSILIYGMMSTLKLDVIVTPDRRIIVQTKDLTDELGYTAVHRQPKFKFVEEFQKAELTGMEVTIFVAQDRETNAFQVFSECRFGYLKDSVRCESSIATKLGEDELRIYSDMNHYVKSLCMAFLNFEG